MKQVAKTFKALSDVTRLRIVTLLTQGELCVCDLMEVLQLPQSTISRHLAYLRNAGLLVDRREAVWMHYRLNEQLEVVGATLWEDLLKELLQQKQAQSDLVKLEEYLAQKTAERCG